MTRTGYYLGAAYNEIEADIWGTNARLYGCHNDVLDIERVLSGLRYKYQEVLRDTEGRLASVLRRLRYLADTAKPGDTVVLFFSGHGTQIPLTGVDFEQSGYDQALVLSNAFLSDDQIWARLLRFRAGVTVILLVDACFSGSMSRLVELGRTQAIGMRDDYRGKVLDPFVALDFLAKHPERVRHGREDVRGSALAGRIEGEAKARIVQFAAGLDTQVVLDGRRNGLFTETMLRHLPTAPSWRELERRVAAETVPKGQTPVLKAYGAATEEDLARRPFVLY